MKKLVLLSLVAVAVSRPLSAQIVVNFSGGSGTPLTVSFASPATFVQTAPSAKGALFLTIEGFAPASLTNITSSLTASINGGGDDVR